jgi:CelD/BcsL family acetyltransferase involved in cellulose biosynthesis
MQAVTSMSAVTRYRVLADQQENDIIARWSSLERKAVATPFQTTRWLSTWYATIGGAVGQPLLLTVLDHWTEELVAMVPLVIRTMGPIRIVEFADAGVSDYIAPVLGSAAPNDAPAAQRFWSALHGALPNVDFLRFDKMPREVEGRINPFVLLPQAKKSSINGNVVIIDGDWADYTGKLERTFRKELGRSWRVFCQRDGATFRRIDDPLKGATVLMELERQQSDRARQKKGEVYHLDKPEYVSFYRELVAEGIGEGSVILTALMCREEVVAALLGVVRGQTYSMVRICSGSQEWSNCSPGRLVITQTMQLLHAQGYRAFDFGIGNHDYKRRLGVCSKPLYRFSMLMSARGLPALTLERAKQFIKRHPGILARVNNIRRMTQNATRPAG